MTKNNQPKSKPQTTPAKVPAKTPANRGKDWGSVAKNASSTVQADGMNAIKGVAESASKVDVELQKSNSQTTTAFHELTKEAVKAAQSESERRAYMQAAADMEKLKQANADKSSERSSITMKGALQILGVVLTAIGGGTAIWYGSKDKK